MSSGSIEAIKLYSHKNTRPGQDLVEKKRKNKVKSGSGGPFGQGQEEEEAQRLPSLIKSHLKKTAGSSVAGSSSRTSVVGDRQGNNTHENDDNDSVQNFVHSILGPRPAALTALEPGSPYVEKEGGVVHSSEMLVKERQVRKAQRDRQAELERALVDLNCLSVDAASRERDQKTVGSRLPKRDHSLVAVKAARKWIEFQQDESKTQVLDVTKQLILDERKKVEALRKAHAAAATGMSSSSSQGRLNDSTQTVGSLRDKKSSTAAAVGHNNSTALTLQNQSHQHQSRSASAPLVQKGDWDQTTSVGSLALGGGGTGIAGKKSGLRPKLLGISSNNKEHVLLKPGEVPKAEVADVHEVLDSIHREGVHAARPTNATTQTVCAAFLYGKQPAKTKHQLQNAPLLNRVINPCVTPSTAWYYNPQATDDYLKEAEEIKKRMKEREAANRRSSGSSREAGETTKDRLLLTPISTAGGSSSSLKREEEKKRKDKKAQRNDSRDEDKKQSSEQDSSPLLKSEPPKSPETSQRHHDDEVNSTGASPQTDDDKKQEDTCSRKGADSQQETSTEKNDESKGTQDSSAIEDGQNTSPSCSSNEAKAEEQEPSVPSPTKETSIDRERTEEGEQEGEEENKPQQLNQIGVVESREEEGSEFDSTPPSPDSTTCKSPAAEKEERRMSATNSPEKDHVTNEEGPQEEANGLQTDRKTDEEKEEPPGEISPEMERETKDLDSAVAAIADEDDQGYSSIEASPEREDKREAPSARDAPSTQTYPPAADTAGEVSKTTAATAEEEDAYEDDANDDYDEEDDFEEQDADDDGKQLAELLRSSKTKQTGVNNDNQDEPSRKEEEPLAVPQHVLDMQRRLEQGGSDDPTEAPSGGTGEFHVFERPSGAGGRPDGAGARRGRGSRGASSSMNNASSQNQSGGGRPIRSSDSLRPSSRASADQKSDNAASGFFGGGARTPSLPPSARTNMSGEEGSLPPTTSEKSKHDKKRDKKQKKEDKKKRKNGGSGRFASEESSLHQTPGEEGDVVGDQGFVEIGGFGGTSEALDDELFGDGDRRKKKKKKDKKRKSE